MFVMFRMNHCPVWSIFIVHESNQVASEEHKLIYISLKYLIFMLIYTYHPQSEHSRPFCLLIMFYLYQDPTQGEISSSDGMRERQLDALMSHEDGAAEKDFGDHELNNSANELSGIVHGEKAKNDRDGSASVDMVELRGIKRSSGDDDLHPDSKKCCSANVDSDGETPNTGNKLSHMEEATKLASQIISSSESDSDSDDSDADISVNARYTGFTFYDCLLFEFWGHNS